MSINRHQGDKVVGNHAPVPIALRGQGPLDVVCLDVAMVDGFVRVGVGDDVVVIRPTLGIATCSWSECVVGYGLSPDSSSVSTGLMVLRDMYERYGGRFANVVVVDRGVTFGSLAFDQLCAGARIEKRQRPPREARFCTTGERLFGIINTQLHHSMSGNAWLTQELRRMTQEVDPRSNLVWTFAVLDRILREFLFSVYPNQAHADLGGMRPNERFKIGVETIGLPRPRANKPELCSRAAPKVDP